MLLASDSGRADAGAGHVALGQYWVKVRVCERSTNPNPPRADSVTPVRIAERIWENAPEDVR